MNNDSRPLRISFAILILMLLFRMITPITDWIYGSFITLGFRAPILLEWFATKVMAPWIFPTFTNLSPVFLIIAIFVNRQNLQSLGVDKPFALMSIYSGLVITWSFFVPVGWLAGLASLFIIIGIVKGYITVKQDTHNYYYPIMILSLICVVIIFITKIDTLNNTTYKNLTLLIVGYIFPGIVYEEFVFRGLLLNYLESKNWGVSKIILFQALIFWIAHINIMLIAPLYFFIGVPIFSLLLGWIAWRTKSLSLSTFVHVLINASIALLG